MRGVVAMTGMNLAMLAAASIAGLLALGGLLYALVVPPSGGDAPADGVVTELPSDWLYGDVNGRAM